MKLRKRIMACTLAAAMLLGSATGVYAEGSRTNDLTVTDVSAQEYQITGKIEESDSYKELKETAPDIVEIIDQVNDGTVEMADFVTKLTEEADALTDETAKKDLEKVIETLRTKDFVTGFVDLIALEAAEKNEEGMYEVTISVPSLTDELRNVQVLHYSTERSLWEIVDPTEIDMEEKTLTAEFEDLSPIAVIADSTTK
ncbi:MAG TPA: PqqD family peptide modification chaperone [Candidatus Blautia intestinavium]|nr:PqqD family peptide modification chaperone [Candidatus Blautia intestinavium]